MIDVLETDELSRAERATLARESQSSDTFAAVIYRARTQRGWNIMQAARETGVSHGNISMMERGLKYPRASMKALADAYGLSLDYLAGLVARERAGVVAKGGRVPKAKIGQE